MSTWSINGTTRQLLSAQRSLTLGARGDSCSLRINGAVTLTHGAACTVATSDGTFFRGLVRRCAEAKFMDGGVTVEGTSVELESKWRLLERLVYFKAIPTGASDTLKTTTRVLLCQDGATTADELADVVAFAAGHLSIVSTLTGTVAPGWESTDATVAEVLMQLLRFHPEAIVRYDHAADVLRIQPRGATPTLSKAMDVEEGAQGGEFSTTSPVQVAGVRLIYNVVTTIDGVPYRETVEDTAGTTSGLDVVVSTFNWSGGTFQSFRQRQEIETEAIPQTTGAANIKAWLRRKVPELRPFSSSNDFVVEEIEQENPDGETTDFTRELVTGTIQPWMPSIEVARVLVRATIKWGRKPLTPEAIAFFGLSRTRECLIELIGTTAITQTYASAPVITGGEDAEGDPPTGVAAQMYANRPLPGPQGSAVWRSAMPDIDLVAGARLSISGCLTVSNALIQTVSDSCSPGAGGLECTTSVSCGPSGFLLSPEPFQQMQRAMARAARHAPKTITSAVAGSGNIDGASKAPASSGKVKERAAVEGFQVVFDRPGGVLIRGGLVVHAVWPDEITPSDPRPIRYAERRVTQQRFTAGTGESIWMEITLVESTYTLEAPLGGLIEHSLVGGQGGTGGDGGRGGRGGDGGAGGNGGKGGGGGGGGGGASPGTAGTAGAAGGYGGAGGLADGLIGGADAGGAGAVGGVGQAGLTPDPGLDAPNLGDPGGPASGGAGTLPSPVVINIPTTTSLLARVWQVAPGASIGLVKGPTNAGKANDSSDLKIYVRLADITEEAIVQHHAGTFFLGPLVVPMIPPPAEEGSGE